MESFTSFYPVKITSRSIARRRTRRVSYLAMSAFFALSITAVIASDPVQKPSSLVAKAPIAAAVHLAGGVAPRIIIAPRAAPAAAPAMTVAAAAPVSAPVAAPAAEKPALAAAQAAPTPQKPAAVYPLVLDLKVANGDTLSNMLTDAGVSADEAHRAVEAMKTIYNPKKLDIGQNVRVKLDKSPGNPNVPVLASLMMPMSNLANLELIRHKDDTFAVKKIDVPTETKLARAGGRIDSSIYETGVDSGLPPALVNEIITAYSYDVDFQREIHEGDNMDVLFERTQTKEGHVTGHGNVVFASLDLGDRHLKIFRYTDKYGHSDYYNEKGESVRKALLRTPINGAHITSGYGMRNHPILGYSKMHRGIDFGAPTGTPIYAAGDGTVAYSGKKGGYGNYLRINHNAKYASAYGHISRFASGIHPGTKVKQGQVVAYVGATGMATGPHLHYEILVNGEQVNPKGVKFKTGNVLGGRELVAFRQNMKQIQTQLAFIPRVKTDVAMLDSADR